MWFITFLVVLIDIIAVNIAGITKINFNIYNNNHQILGQMDPGIMRAVFAIVLLLCAKRYWKIDIMHERGGYSHMFKEGWPVIAIVILNMTLASDHIMWTNLLHNMNAQNIILAFGIGLIEALFVGMFEEISFRGIIMGAMLKGFKKYPVMKSIFFSGIVFGSLHMLNYLVSPFWDTTNQIIYAAGIGFVLGTVYYISKNIWVPIILHALVDYAGLVFSMNSTYLNTAEANEINLSSLIIFVIGIISSYVFLIVYNRKQGKKAWIY